MVNMDTYQYSFLMSANINTSLYAPNLMIMIIFFSIQTGRADVKAPALAYL